MSGSKGNAWLWVANPRKWNDADGVPAFECLRRYLEGGNVYWATPILQEVAEGDLAYIWRTKSSHSKHYGVAAVGKVAEAPRFYTGDNKQDFRFPDQLEAQGWDESRATSELKTGISLRHHFWQEPVPIHFAPGYLYGKTVVRLTGEQHQRISKAIREREGGDHDKPT
jgi:hypothetical protein